MLKRYSLRILFLAIIIFGAGRFALAQTDPIEHTWFNEEKSAKIHIYKAVDGKFYGKIVWMAQPNRNGKPKLDINNSDETKRNNPVVGLVILKNFSRKEANRYEDGTIYDPKSGKTYSSKMTLEGNKLSVRGYLGFSFIGRSTEWTKAD